MAFVLEAFFAEMELETSENCEAVGKITIITSTFILQNNVVDQDQRGAANGIAMTAMSLFKAVGPAAGGAVFSWAQRRQVAAFLPAFTSLQVPGS
ncbi:unnamed protein product [Camellia sinensis]